MRARPAASVAALAHLGRAGKHRTRRLREDVWPISPNRGGGLLVYVCELRHTQLTSSPAFELTLRLAEAENLRLRERLNESLLVLFEHDLPFEPWLLAPACPANMPAHRKHEQK